MPHLAFDLNFAPPAAARRRLGDAIVKRFSEIMETGTDHIGVIVRCHGPDDLVFGRAEGPERRVVFVNADIRRGRTADQKRQLALAFIDEAHAALGVPKKAVYVVYTEHDGEHFQLEEKVLPSWTAGEDPLAGS
jgi:phenylpyruvate tautomerase PptA (4-oxalocrotonate tautomerase family)